MEEFDGNILNRQEKQPMSSLEKAKLEIPKENPSLPMQLRFEVSSPETIEKLLTVKDLTLPTEDGQERNIIGKIFDQVIDKLKEYHFSDIHIERGNPIVDARDNF